MDDVILAMIDKRRPRDEAEWDRALREVLQEAALAGLWRRGFFEKAAFYGGTALRLFHGLDRFSEDLDFSLLKADPAWKLTERLEGLKDEIEAFGFSVDIATKHEGGIESAFIIRIAAPESIAGRTVSNRSIKVKLETDTVPPRGIKTEMKTLLEPFPFTVRVVTPPCLFAGKLHACIARAWKTRVKGRDWYDLLFFIARGVPVDLGHLEARLRQSGQWSEERALELGNVRRLLLERIEAIDWRQARDDMLPFVRDARAVEAWDAALFRDVVVRVQCEHPSL
jgi:predicted nucleotidyltransferase component of viral defense system